MSFEESFGIGKNFLRRNTEKLSRALTDVGIANLVVGRHHTLVDDPWNGGNKRCKTFVPHVQCSLTLSSTDDKTDEGHERQQNALVFCMRLSRRRIIQRKEAGETLAAFDDRFHPATVQSMRQGFASVLRPPWVRQEVCNDDPFAAQRRSCRGVARIVRQSHTDGI